jgi:hypothetical protein
VVIDLEVPADAQGYHTYALRVESARVAAELDHRIAAAWSGHPRRFLIRAGPDFAAKAREALELIRAQLPACCHRHTLAPAGSDAD